MKPKMLKISGLNSFCKEQTVDFDKLTEKGLFGIFGPTGSGKSTILDAITIAMYGKISRDTKEFINTESDTANVCYEFEIGKGSSRKTYIVDRSVKRDTKTGGYKTSMARVREATQNGDVILAEGPRDVQETITDIVGLSAEDFTRSVVLPQGKFNEFLKLTGSDRRNMLERIFGLEKYGIKLVKKIRFTKGQNQSEYNKLEGELNRYVGISEDIYKGLEKELSCLLEEEKVLKKDKEKQDKMYQKYRGIWEKQEELKKIKLKREELNLRLKDIEDKKIRLKRAKDALSVKPFIDNFNDTKNRIQNNNIEMEKVKSLIEALDSNLSNIEKEYSSALEKKDKEIPILIEKEARLKQAIDIVCEIENIKKEIVELRVEYDKNKKEIEKYEKDFNKYILDINNASNRSLEIENRIAKINFNPEYKQKVMAAFDLEKEYKRISADINAKEDRILKLKEDINAKKQEYAAIINNKDENERDIKLFIEKQSNLKKGFPGDTNLLISKKGELELLRQRFNEAVDRDKRYRDISDALSKITILKEEEQNKYRKLKKELDEKVKDLDTLKKEIEDLKIKNIVGALVHEVREGEPCPLCGSIEHPKLAPKTSSKELDEKQSLMRDLEAYIDKLSSQINTINVNISKITAEEDIKNAEKSKESQNDLDIKGLEQEVKRKEKEFEALNNKIAIWNVEKEEIEKKLGELKDRKGTIGAVYARAQEGLSKDQNLLDTLMKEMDTLNKSFEEVKRSYEKEKKELDIDNIGLKLKEINNNEREIDSLQKEDKSLKIIRQDLDKKKDTLLDRLNGLKLKKAQIEESGKEKSKYIKEKQDTVDKLSEKKDPKEYIEEVRHNISAIKEKEETLKRELESKKNERQKVQDKKIGLERNYETLKNLYDTHKKKLDEALKDMEFIDEDEALAYLIDKSIMLSMEDEIKRYIDESVFVDKNIERLNLQLEGKTIDEQKWEEIQKSIKDMADTLSKKASEIGAKNQKIKDMEKDLETVKVLNKQKKELEHRLDLLQELDRLVQGNAFVEYVARGQLNYIAAEASKRLKDITRGRYALELDASGNFVMRDDFNGGNRRGADTLSGGETFLTSLSLAIALSSQIQLKGSAPLEFFFLDEGFGTLDSELLETVMTSLERLHSDRLCVGIISHVEELKNRVPVKLIVSPAVDGGDGSKVHIEYS
jgi:exonuclease SbcC